MHRAGAAGRRLIIAGRFGKGRKAPGGDGIRQRQIRACGAAGRPRRDMTATSKVRANTGM